MKKWLPLVLLIAAAFAWYAEQARESAFDAPTQPVETARADGARVEASPSIETLFAQRLSSVQVQGAGIVSRLLSDDNEGSRHQRFILELPSGHTLLVAHNIDLPRGSTRSRKATASNSSASTSGTSAAA
jgi:Protein of unknown function (DUF3465).